MRQVLRTVRRDALLLVVIIAVSLVLDVIILPPLTLRMVLLTVAVVVVGRTVGALDHWHQRRELFA
jgi:hypothetical protein